MTLKNKIYMKIYDSPTAAVPILDATDLRTDFDVRHLPGYSKGKFVIYNLNDETVLSIVNGERYISVDIQEGDGPIINIVNRFYINNVIDEVNLPDQIVSLFAFDILRKNVLQHPLGEVLVQNPSLERMVNQVLSTSPDWRGEAKFKYFPNESHKVVPDGPASRNVGGGRSIQDCLQHFGSNEFKFKMYTVDANLIFAFMPSEANVQMTKYAEEPVILLRPEAMRANPMIGAAELTITSILDTSIKCSAVLDISQLVSVGSNLTQEQLEVADSFAAKTAGNSRYQAFAIQHKGSNYTDAWTTIVTSYSPTKGTNMPTTSSRWAQIDY